jgi:hypothetical protein
MNAIEEVEHRMEAVTRTLSVGEDKHLVFARPGSSVAERRAAIEGMLRDMDARPVSESAESMVDAVNAERWRTQ